MGRWHTQRLHVDGRGHVAACLDVDRRASERLRDELAPAASVCSSMEDVLHPAAGENRPGVDVAILCTPTPEHFEQAVRCLDAGVHVLCEKPLAETRGRILELIERHRRGPARLAVAYQRRSQGIFRTLRREVRSGAWGRVTAVASHNVENWRQTIGGTWRDDPRINWGGFVGDAGSHKIDMAFHVTGLRPIEVFARTDRCGAHVEIQASVSAKLEGGVPLTMDFIGDAQYLGEDLQIHCEKADWILRHGDLWVGRAGRLERFTALLPDSDPVVDFLDLLAANGPEVAPPECALPVFDFTEALLISARTALPVCVPARR